MVSVVTLSPALPIHSQVLPGHNQEAYQRLQSILQATPPYQLCFAACDDLPLQRQLSATLETSLQTRGATFATQLVFAANNPDLVQQLRHWSQQTTAQRTSLLQLLGVEQLTYQEADQQYRFLMSLHGLVPAWRQLECNLVIWLPRPWLRQVKRTVPSLCQTVFEFMGEPTPLLEMAAEQPNPAAFSPVRQWQFLLDIDSPPGKPSAASYKQAVPTVAEPAPREESSGKPSTPVAGTPWAEAEPNEIDPWSVAYELRDRVQVGDRRLETLQAAIHQYETLQPEALTTPHRTEVLNDLGSLYWLLAQQASNAETYQHHLIHSAELYEAALSPLSPGTGSGILTRLHSNLGSVYSLLATLETPTHYLDKAIRAFHRALQYTPVETVPTEYAALQTHLGTAYWSLAQHTDDANHLHRAVSAYQEALQQSPPQQVPQAYAQLQNNLGITLWSLSRHERPVFLLEQAISAYHNALAYRTIDTDLAGCAATHNNLGTAYWALGGHCPERSPEQQNAWQQAISAYETALSAAAKVPSAALGFDLWATHHSVGVVYDQMAITLVPDAEAQKPLLTQAITHYTKALMGWQAQGVTTTRTVFQAIVRNLHLQAQYLGLEAQQQSLGQIPADWLPEIWRKL